MCGIFGVYNLDGEDISGKLRLGIFALQSRGQEACGMSICNGNNIKHHKDLGLVMQVFNNDRMHKMFGYAGIAQVRYSTTGKNERSNSQPFRAVTRNGDNTNHEIHLAHNGNIPDCSILKEELRKLGAEFNGTSDSEVILKYLSYNYHGDMVGTIRQMMQVIKGSYSLLILFKDHLYAVRDPMGNRPLIFGQIGPRTFAFSSETYSFEIMGGKAIRDVNPGEILVLEQNGPRSYVGIKKVHRARCIFEWVYLQDSTSTLDGESVAAMRVESGRLLAKYVPVDDIDCVIGIPETGIYAAQGLADEIGKPLSNGIIRNRYATRTFIEPDETTRRYLIRMKLKPIGEFINGKSICLIDDSLIRGNTMLEIVKMLEEYNPKQIHVAIASPPAIETCDLGVSIKSKKELIAANNSVEDIRKILGVTTLSYLTVDDLVSASKQEKNTLCLHCFNGCHPLNGKHEREAEQEDKITLT